MIAAQHARHTLVTHEQHVAGQVRSAYARAQVQMAPHVRAFVARYGAELYRRRAEAHAQEMVDSGDTDEARDAAQRVRVPSTWLTDRTPHTGGNVRAVQVAIAGALTAFAAESATHLTAGRGAVRQTATQQARQTLHQASATVWQHQPANASTTAGDDDDDGEDDAGGADDCSTYNGRPLVTLTQHAADVTADGILATLLAAFAAGVSADALADVLWQKVGGALSWTQTICRTELALLWRAVTLDTWRGDPTSVIVGWTWRAQPTACDECTDLDGTQHPLDEDMAGLHPNCQCYAEPITAADDSPFSTSPSTTASTSALADEAESESDDLEE